MRLLPSSYLLLLLTFGASMADAQNVAPPRTLDEALTAEFKCPTGAHDSGGGPIPGTVVRWCDIERDGRPVYHGPVWRWYPSGELEGKEYWCRTLGFLGAPLCEFSLISARKNCDVVCDVTLSCQRVQVLANGLHRVQCLRLDFPAKRVSSDRYPNRLLRARTLR
jgi:hypothetical protein